MKAGAGEVDDLRKPLDWLHLIRVDAVQERAGRVRSVRVLIRQATDIAAALIIPALAGGDASLTADTSVEVNDEAQLFFGVGRQMCHARSLQVSWSKSLVPTIFPRKF